MRHNTTGPVAILSRQPAILGEPVPLGPWRKALLFSVGLGAALGLNLLVGPGAAVWRSPVSSGPIEPVRAALAPTSSVPTTSPRAAVAPSTPEAKAEPVAAPSVPEAKAEPVAAPSVPEAQAEPVAAPSVPEAQAEPVAAKPHRRVGERRSKVAKADKASRSTKRHPPKHRHR